MVIKSSDSGNAAPRRPDDRSNHRHRQLIGYIGLVLPMLLILLVLNRDGLEVWQKLDSVSAYYYTGAVSAFSGMLVALALFLFAYKGYQNESQWADRWFSVVGGVAAIGVAFFPTSAPKGFPTVAWVEPWVVRVHFSSAVVLFGVFALFSLWLFRKKSKDDTAKDSYKTARNTIYLICGIVIISAIVWAGINSFQQKSIFWPESVALVFFSISWLVKGYALRSIREVAGTVAHKVGLVKKPLMPGQPQ